MCVCPGGGNALVSSVGETHPMCGGCRAVCCRGRRACGVQCMMCDVWYITRNTDKG